MNGSNLIVGKSMDFAVRIVNLYKYLTKEKSEYILSKQLLRSGTSIGANVSEAVRAQSTADFIAKMYIGSNFWKKQTTFPIFKRKVF